MSTVVPPAFAWGKGGEIFATLVRDGTGGRINIKQYPGASLVQGQQVREFSAMRQGVIDVLCGAPVNWTGTVRELGVFTLPFLFPDHRSWDAVMQSDAVQRDYFDLVRKAGAEPLAVGETGFRQISNSKRPITKPADDVLLFAIAASVWQSWSVDDRRIVREAGVEAARQQVQLVRRLFADDVDKVKALGVDVHVPDAKELAVWQLATRRTYARWKAQTGAPLLDKVEAILEKTLKS